MRLSYIIFLATAALIATSTSGQGQNAEISAPATWENDIPIKRFLRKRDTNDAEERAINFKVPVKVKQFGGKVKRLSIYNALLVLARKKPKWVLEHYPHLYDGYRRFYRNRMVEGVKYS
ncbi:secreted RxLR effector peptide protein, putative [Phytophthora infestans T30-4]|uniref:RxLR effector protein n=2 Tax=Phytophthora infestans TaxID=4787 RepID=D0MXB9_PHYIT|nr:secreted RxLR effector peptide protein, putative [Phytophthora infestans T30-4]EEY64282.1 secreted RxLR effector peptide protein, putative [Phytophthora infestans T30-4]KAF4032972.1 hypothetical protein GN244_ATG15077 [Phytophthora infestans]KAF4129714.1 hypothetical protein GN958_ATG21209 [Phytophthora infestans]KAI9986300.1 hypothetical protein PInf_025238 [Phytophthora infestans]|eukprot:XP_002907718.1 secreted RxLR effector peptide protein, putative [Phytophthora infestans T30-4]